MFRDQNSVKFLAKNVDTQLKHCSTDDDLGKSVSNAIRIDLLIVIAILYENVVKLLFPGGHSHNNICYAYSVLHQLLQS